MRKAKGTAIVEKLIPMNTMASDAGESSRGETKTDGSLGVKLVLDKSVDSYIRKIQKQLPTISETGSPTKRGKKKIAALQDFDEEQTFDLTISTTF